jgi:AAA family ATP:ADP antiporter
VPVVKVADRVFNLRAGDLARGFPLFAYYFLIITFYMMGRVARDAIFLDHFPAIDLPYEDIAGAVLAALFAALYIRASRQANLRALQMGSLLFLSANLIAFWWGVHVEHWAWVAAVLYIWVGVCGVLMVTQVWTLANFVWTTREAKRLFGLLGSGGIAGGIAGGFLAKRIAETIGTDDMLLFMAVALLPCMALVGVIWKQRPAARENESTQTLLGPRGVLASFQQVRRSPHLRTIAILIGLASMVTTVAGWQLKAIAKDTLVYKDALAAYLGAFTEYSGMASLAVQLLITPKVLRRFGVGVALLILPLSLMAGSLAVAMWGTLWAATLLRGSDGVFRYSIDTSAVQLLYLPVPSRIKLQVKSFIDTVVWKTGDGMAGLVLLLFATTWHVTARRISYVTIVLLAAWIVAAVRARRQYVATLRDNIQQVRLRPREVLVPTLDQSATHMFAERLTSANPEEVLYALDLFEMGQQVQSHVAVRQLLAHPSPIIRKKAVSILNGAADRSVRADITALLRDEDLDVRTEALRYLTRHDHVDPLAMIVELGDFADVAIRSATVAFLARPGEQQNLDAASMLLDRMVREPGDEGQPTRLEAARLIASLPDHFEDPLGVLMADRDPAVLREAFRTAGLQRKRRLVPAIVDHLRTKTLRTDAIDALVLFGDEIIGTLCERLGDPEASLEVRRQVPQVLLRIGTPVAARALADTLLQADPTVRSRIIAALNKLHETRRDLRIDRSLIESAMVAELMGHYRSYQILGTLGGVPDASLEASMAEEMERVFRLTKLLFPTIDLQSAHAGIRSPDPIMHANALEFLDNTLDPRLRGLLVPLLDSEVSVDERIRLADRFLGFSVN